MDKRCTVCKQIKHIDEFYFKNRQLGTRHPLCKQCMSEKSVNGYGTEFSVEELRISAKIALAYWNTKLNYDD